MPPEKSSDYAEEGTAAHALSETVLRNRLGIISEESLKGTPAEEVLTRGKETSYYLNLRFPQVPTITVTEEMVEKAGEYVEAVWTAAQGGDLYVEERVDFSHVVGVPNSFGTADAIVLAKVSPDEEVYELQVHDLKYGMGVAVSAVENDQLRIYALGALRKYEMLYDIVQVRLFIHMPRLNFVSEWPVSLDDLALFGADVFFTAGEAIAITELDGDERVYEKVPTSFYPGEKQCRFCKAKPTCPALAKVVLETVTGEFEDCTPELIKENTGTMDADALGRYMGMVDLIDGWTKAVRGTVFSELDAGRPVPGYKLVEGKRGNRSWSAPAQAEKEMKAMRLKVEDMYDLKIISPTTAEKVLKENPRRWKKLQSLIVRPDGKPSVAPESDKRPALVVESFEDISLL